MSPSSVDPALVADGVWWRYRREDRPRPGDVGARGPVLVAALLVAVAARLRRRRS